MGWHAGSSLSQTVYTLLYVHNLAHIAPERHNIQVAQKHPLELVSLVLRALVIGLLKTCDLIWRDVTRSQIYDVSSITVYPLCF
jgi:N-alpha-acetyltransferase 35, NatC auxiliary subunit